MDNVLKTIEAKISKGFVIEAPFEIEALVDVSADTYDKLEAIIDEPVYLDGYINGFSAGVYAILKRIKENN